MLKFSSLIDALFQGQDIESVVTLNKLPTLSLDQRKDLIKACRAQYFPLSLIAELGKQLATLHTLPSYALFSLEDFPPYFYKFSQYSSKGRCLNPIEQSYLLNNWADFSPDDFMSQEEFDLIDKYDQMFFEDLLHP
jgi:hypothetical protein